MTVCRLNNKIISAWLYRLNTTNALLDQRKTWENNIRNGTDSSRIVKNAFILQVTKTAGTVLVVGIGDDKVEVPLSPALLREVDIKGSFRIMNTYVT